MTADHCLITLLWSETGDNGQPLDSGDYEPSPELIARITADWDQFRERAEGMGFDPDDHLAMMLHPDNDGDPWNAAVHDFILTRNGHGVGFWDGRWHDPWGDRLTELAEGFGPVECYMGDDGLIYAI